MARIKGITINTDTSWCPNENIGGYAFWIKSDHFHIKYANSFTDEIKSSDDAEIKCIINALHVLLKYQLYDREFKYIYINTDSTSAIGQICKQTSDIGKHAHELIQRVILESKSIERFDLRHVKGHSQNKNSRSIVNRWCDKHAGDFMRKKRLEIHKEKCKNEQKSNNNNHS